MKIVKRIGPWALSAAVHGAFLAVAIVTMTGIAATPPTAERKEDAVYSVTLRPGGRPSIENVTRTEEREFGAPTSEAPAIQEAPREAVDDMRLVRPLERESGHGRASSPIMYPSGPSSRTGGKIRFDSTGPSGGGSGSGTGSGVGEGSDPGVEAVPLDTPTPKYPEAARRDHLQGTVIIEIRIDTAGRVESARVTEGSGRSILDDAAVAAVRTWSYRPATLNGKAIASLRRVRLVFRLE